MLRYRTGDLVKGRAQTAKSGRDPAQGRCPARADGMTWRWREGSGRVDDMVIVRGVNVHPGAVEGIVREIGGIAEYQVVLTSRGPLTELRLRVEPVAGSPSPEDLLEQLRRAFERSLSLRVPVELVGAGILPRFEMKAKRWVRE